MNPTVLFMMRLTMKVKVYCFIGEMNIKEIVHLNKFEDAEKTAKYEDKF